MLPTCCGEQVTRLFWLHARYTESCGRSIEVWSFLGTLAEATGHVRNSDAEAVLHNFVPVTFQSVRVTQV